MKKRVIVADAGLLFPEAGVVCLDKFDVDLWMCHNSAEMLRASNEYGSPLESVNRATDIGTALHHLEMVYGRKVEKSEILYLARRVNWIGRFTAGAGTTCGEWTRPVDKAGHKGFFKGNPATGVCPVNCSFCYLRGVPFGVNSLALNVGEYAEQVARKRAVRNRQEIPRIINLSETGGPIEWAVEYGLQEWIQALTDATLDAGVVPYWLTKRVIAGLDLSKAHVGISINPWRTMKTHSPGASHPARLIDFLGNAKLQGVSTVVRLGPLMDDGVTELFFLEEMMRANNLHDGRITVDLLRFSKRHPAIPNGYSYRAHKWQESPSVQRAHLAMVRELFPDAHITGCKLDPGWARQWVKEGLIQSFPCACWV
jgi:DNA repair photolyase